MVFLNFSKIDSNSKIEYTIFMNLISVNIDIDIYLNNIFYVSNCNLNILNSDFYFIYAKSSLLVAIGRSNIIITNSMFIDYNPIKFYELIFSYLFIMENGVLSFKSSNNTIKNTNFILNSNSDINIFDKNIITIIPSNTYIINYIVII